MRLFREDLLQINPPRLLGSRCASCGTASFPAREFCPSCQAQDAQAKVQLTPEGTVFSYTVIHQSPDGRAVPYVLAYVDLRDQVRVLAQLEHPHEEVRVGMTVTLAPKQLRVEDGAPIIGYVFVAAESQGAS